MYYSIESALSTLAVRFNFVCLFFSHNWVYKVNIMYIYKIRKKYDYVTKYNSDLKLE